MFAFLVVFFQFHLLGEILILVIMPSLETLHCRVRLDIMLLSPLNKELGILDEKGTCKVAKYFDSVLKPF